MFRICRIMKEEIGKEIDYFFQDAMGCICKVASRVVANPAGIKYKWNKFWRVDGIRAFC